MQCAHLSAAISAQNDVDVCSSCLSWTEVRGPIAVNGMSLGFRCHATSYNYAGELIPALF